MAADIHLHLFDYDIDADGDYQVPARVGTAAFNAMGSPHNHGDAVLTVASIVFANEVNCTAEIIGGPPPGPTGTYDPDEAREFVIQVTPIGYGPWSFQQVITSDDPDTPVLTATFEGYSVPLPDDSRIWRAQPRRTVWRAPSRITVWRA